MDDNSDNFEITPDQVKMAFTALKTATAPCYKKLNRNLEVSFRFGDVYIFKRKNSHRSFAFNVVTAEFCGADAEGPFTSAYRAYNWINI